jgi:putative DNA primase/helicase
MSEAVARIVLRLKAKRTGKGWKAKCPAHEDHEPSLNIDEGADGRALLKCQAGCDTKDVLAALGITFRDLFPDPQPSGATSSTPPRFPRLKVLEPNEQAFNWRSCVDAFTDKHVEQIAEWRGYSRSFVKELRDKGQIGIYEGLVAFPVHNDGKIVGTHYRLRDGSWCYFPKGTKTRPLVIGELATGDTVHVFESQWDAFAFMDVSGEWHGIIITRGASNGVPVADVIPKDAKVYVWPQNDAPGEKWATDIWTSVKVAVKRVKIPAAYKDLNAWTLALGGARERDLIDAMGSAETVRESEKSWADALNEAIVTSNELHGLKLIPRRKLLGDWFCEGDLGFVFAFRGIGKTWIALGIAWAVSTGNKLGDFQAHECVKVLYVDGEMPPDLMRDRFDGLSAANSNLEFLNHEILFDRTGKVLNIASRDIQDAITKRCINTGVRVLILDNLSTLASGMKENEADSWEKVNAWLLHLRRRKIAVVIIHHAGRSGEMRGTSKREDNVFWIIALDDAKKNAEDKRGARFISRFTKPSRNTQEEIPAYEWHFVTDQVTGMVSVGCKLAQTMDVFLGLIDDGVTECSEIAEEMKTSKASVSRMAKKAYDAGKIIIKSRGYFLREGAKNDPQKS